MKEADYSMAKNSGTSNRGLFAGILGTLAALGIGINDTVSSSGCMLSVSQSYKVGSTINIYFVHYIIRLYFILKPN